MHRDGSLLFGLIHHQFKGCVCRKGGKLDLQIGGDFGHYSDSKKKCLAERYIDLAFILRQNSADRVDRRFSAGLPSG